MNNIYKVIWSKAKNCYVVASEIARSHTKSATGSGKIGGVTRRSLLASLMALSLLCGGLGVAEASVHVVESGETYEVLTKQEVKDGYGTKDDVKSNKYNIEKLQTTTTQQGTQIAINTTNIATNKANISALQTTATEQGKLIETNTANIANNTTAIEKKINAETANERFATRDALNDLQNQVTNKVDDNTFEDALKLKADTDLSNLTEEGKTAIKTTMADELAKKADAANVYTMDKVDEKLDLKANKAEVSASLNEKADKTALNQATDRITANETAIAGLTTKTTDQQTAIDDLKKKTTQISYADGDGTRISGVTIKNGNIVGDGNSAITQLANVETDKIETDEINGKSLAGTTVATATEVEAETLARKEADTALGQRIDKEIQDREAADTALEGKITKNSEDITKLQGDVTTAQGDIAGLNAKDTELEGKIKTNADNIQKNKDAIAATDKRTAGIDRIDATKETTIEGNVTVNSLGNVTAEGDVTAKGKLTGDGVDAGAGAITTKGAVNAGSLNVTDASNLKGDVTMEKTLKVTGDTSLGKTDVGGALNVTGASDLKGDVTLGTPNGTNTVTVNGTAHFNEAANMNKGLNVTSGDTDLKNTTVDGTLSVNKETTLNGKLTANDEATFTKKVTMENDLEVKGELKTDKIAMEHTGTDADGTRYNSATTITADGITHIGEVEKSGVITKSQFTHTEEGSETYAKKGNTANWTETRSDVKADGVTTKVEDSKKNRTNTSQTADGIKGYATDKDGNKTYTKVTATENSFQVQDKDGKNKNHQVNTMGSSVTEIKNDEGKTTKTEQTAENITNTAKDGTIKNDAKDIVNNASGNISNKSQTMDTTVTGKATESYGSLDTTVNGNETHIVKGTKTETVDGKVTENYNAGQATKVTGNQDIHVTGKQTNTVEGGQENIISGGQTNTITGGQVNNITGDQTTTITGNKTETVTENVTEDYKKNLTTTVGGNEIHDVKGTKTETVEGKVTENFKGGQETNVTGNQDIHVTGKQTNKIDGDQENTIGGNQTTTVTGDISNKAKNITNEASNSITDKVGDHTRVLDSDGITDTVGGSTFKQRIDKIMMESKNVSIKAEETLTNEAKVITNKASEVINNEAVNINNTATGIIKSKASEIQNQADKLISNKVGENTWENMENGKITTSIKDGAKQNLTQSDAAGTTQSTVDGGKSTVTIQNADGLADAVTDGTNTSVQNQTASAIAAAVKDGAGNENASVANATTSVNTIKSGSKANTVISTADGTSFINSEAAAPVGDGTEVKTTIKGNTITTGKVTMDYAEVMKDLGVRGNANIAGKTTTGSLEVKGESKLTGDVTMESNATVKKDLTVEGNTNLKNTKVDGTLDVTQKATFGDSVSIAKDLSVDGNATIKGDVTAKSYKVGDKTYISAAGINANDQKITNVADGSISEGSKDAVNGGQLYTVKNDLEGKVNKVGANAAAMANLHPMEFDPSSKWNIAAAIGNYGSETAAALGAFYRPNDDVMVNLSTAFGTGENMVGGGVSVRLGKGGNKLSREETNALKAQVADLTARMDALLSVLNPNMSKDFPDVPENHWAYEAVSRLAGNDIVQGYPDGEFHGERTMTRYEMAEIIYNALSRGAEAEKELVEEFKPELQAMAASEKATAEKAEG